jgi:cobalt/nickel transport system permease protein
LRGFALYPFVAFFFDLTLDPEAENGMHISEGVLSAPVLLSGAALTLGGTAVGLRKLDYDRMPQVAVLSAGFFVASLVHVPIGPANVHLVLNGLVGLFLGWSVFPAILVGLILQAVLFQFGGFTSLGVNTVIMALPGLICYYAFGGGVRSEKKTVSIIASFLCGAMAVLLGSLLVALALVFTGEAFVTVAKLVVIGHLPVMVIEGFVAVFCVKFLKKVRPEILEVGHAR